MGIDLLHLCTKIEKHRTQASGIFSITLKLLDLTQDFLFLSFFQSTTTKSESNYEDELVADPKDEEHARYATTRSQHQQGLDLFLVGLWTSRTEIIA